ncbi:DUF1631 family protein [Hydrogenophaga sp.]|uniref:DUF1631 family protein n=1 Tax=Hydrogenophaga sp. TaxID=1904254 RepID=UPI0019ADBBC5|nr:DUF1631 family protein [Hydrogenophaga sp.]MBD3892902.1 DUF1631 family protein [Hydrogenophaga sp.]
MQTDSFDACLKEALVQTRQWVPRWLDQLHATLLERERAVGHLHERQILLQARVTLESHRELIASRFLAAFSESIEGALPQQGRPVRPLDALSLDELELMGHEQVQETVEFARVQQLIMMAVDLELVALNARISSARGLQGVRLQANPLRPELVIAALMRALNGVHVDPVLRSRWLQTGALALGKELQAMYARLSALLDGWGVAPAGFVVTQHVQNRAAHASLAGLGPVAQAVPKPSLPGNEALLTLDHLHQLLVGNLQPAVGPAGAADQTDASSTMVRVLAAEVVTLMLQRIADDTRLLAPLRDLLLQMKPALLQLARSEPRFFADRDNPARQLLDAITAQSLAFPSEDKPGFSQFASQVQHILRTLQQPGVDLQQCFPVLLAEFKRSLAESVEPAQLQARGLAVQTLLRVEQRNLLAERVAAEFRARSDYARAPGVVRRFLTGPWAQVVAQARMNENDPAAKPGAPLLATSTALRYSGLLSDLLWSAQLQQASQNRPRLVKIIPGLLRTLREGLDGIDYPRKQTEIFFQALLGLHEAAYKTQRIERAPAEEYPSLQPEEEPWMQRAEARDTGFMEDAPAPVQPVFADTLPMQGDWVDIKVDPTPDSATDVTRDLKVGTWVDIWQQGQALRCQISWASPHGTMYLFTGSGGRSLSMTRRGLKRLLAQDRLRVVAEQGVVDEALDAVARQAWINSAAVQQPGDPG